MNAYCGTLTFDSPINRDDLVENRNWFIRFVCNITIGMDPDDPTRAVFCVPAGRVQEPDWLETLKKDCRNGEYAELLGDWLCDQLKEYLGAAATAREVRGLSDMDLDMREAYKVADALSSMGTRFGPREDAPSPVFTLGDFAAAKPAAAEPERHASTLEGALGRLDRLIGMDAAKRQVHDIAAIVQNRGADALPCLHTVLTGNPGTGKTELARCLADVLAALGVCAPGKLVETDRSGLVAKYVGHTAQQTLAAINKAKGGVLFIDEAYALGACGSLGAALDDENRRNDFGPEAIDTIVKQMEDCRNNPIIIMAGYPDLMEKMLSVNPGLRDRVGFTIHLDDYSAEELSRIAAKMFEDRGYVLTDEAWGRLCAAVADIERNKDRDFANARLMRKLAERCIFKQNVRTGGYEVDVCDVDAALVDGDFAERVNGRIRRAPIGFVA
ncbi:MAG: AAA family ATPase [Eggerthellaceae bacterium]|nr:AAA family ATPase [Eggerthellaceae bacterium]